MAAEIVEVVFELLSQAFHHELLVYADKGVPVVNIPCCWGIMTWLGSCKRAIHNYGRRCTINLEKAHVLAS